ncbi:hypothetical protein F2Q69_00057109 [Brassica cretica]|uniref:Uncharacterized protein n=1 Tax=Brassica cretica TaxID=69181 RepID=A0A8S9MTV0_BRACR|nr:hypothetical protein F2Q69_00057109 [Brassica cretica]
MVSFNYFKLQRGNANVLQSSASPSQTINHHKTLKLKETTFQAQTEIARDLGKEKRRGKRIGRPSQPRSERKISGADARARDGGGIEKMNGSQSPPAKCPLRDVSSSPRSVLL